MNFIENLVPDEPIDTVVGADIKRGRVKGKESRHAGLRRNVLSKRSELSQNEHSVTPVVPIDPERVVELPRYLLKSVI